jgi:low temperature requirement protein LtrA
VESTTATRSQRATSLELFFDLTFVFTVTQLTGLLAGRADLTGVAMVALILVPTWWMYGAYVWLTNAIATSQLELRLLLLGGMGGFLVTALAIPTAFDGSGETFAIGYAVVIALHSGLFIIGSSNREASGLRDIAPFNIGSAILLVTGGALGGDTQWALWIAASALLWCWAIFFPPRPGFVIEPEHWAERHSLVIIIALGESIIAIGIGAKDLPVDAALVSAALAGLALVSALWWTYFSDEEHAARALADTAEEHRPRLAAGFSVTHFFLIAAIIAVAAGLKKVLEHPYEPLQEIASAWLVFGVAIYLLADVAHRRLIGTGDHGVRLTIALLAWPLFWLGTEVAGAALVGGLALLLAVGLAIEGRSLPEEE